MRKEAPERPADVQGLPCPVYAEVEEEADCGDFMKFDNPEEQYVYDERISLLLAGEDREPTEVEKHLARKDVIRYLEETLNQRVSEH